MPLSDWNSLVAQDGFRAATPEKQQEFRMAWLSQVAPKIYGDSWNDPSTQRNITQMVFNPVPAKLPDEDKIFTPDKLSYNNYVNLENDPTFRQHDYKDQQTLRWAWFNKSVQNDPTMKAMNPEQLSNVYEALMSRAPVSGERQLGSDNYLYTVPNESILEADAKNKASANSALNVVTKIAGNIESPFIQLVSGLTGWTDKDYAQSLHSLIDTIEWRNGQTDKEHSFFSETVPNLVGNALMFGSKGPGGALTDVLGGQATGGLIKGIAGVGMEHTPGLLGTLGKTVGLKMIPQEVTSILGSTVAGAGIAVAQNIGSGNAPTQDLASNIIQNIGFSSVAEFGGQLLRARQLAKAMGANAQQVADTLYGKFDPNQMLNPEMQDILKAHPDGAKLVNSSMAFHKSGLPLNLSKDHNVITTLGDQLGMKVHFEGNGVVVEDATTGSPLFRRTNITDPIAQADAVWEYFDTVPDKITPASLLRKSPSEIANMQKSLTVYKGSYDRAPERSFLKDSLTNLGVPVSLGVDTSHPDTMVLDKIADEIKAYKTDSTKSMETLAYKLSGQYGVKLDNVEDTRMLWNGLRKLSPNGIKIYTDTTTGQAIQDFRDTIKSLGVQVDKNIQTNPSRTPPLAFISTTATNFADNTVMVASSSQIREFLNRTATRESIGKGLDTKQANGASLGGNLTEIGRAGPNDLYTVRMTIPAKVPGGYTTADVSFTSVREMQKFLARGGSFTASGNFNAGTKVFTDKVSQKAYHDFVREQSAGNPKAIAGMYMPYEFMSKNAVDNGYNLSMFKDKYYLTDIIDPDASQLKKNVFDSLNEVNQYLLKHNTNSVTDMIDLPKTSLDEASKAVGGTLNPKEILEEAQYSKKSTYGIANMAKMAMSPQDYNATTFAHFKDLDAVGIDPIKNYNDMALMVQTQNSFMGERGKYINNVLTKGISKAESADLVQYIQAYDSADHATKMLGDHVGDLEFVTKRELEATWMADAKKGPDYVAKMQKHSALTHQYLDGLFSMMGLNKDTYVYNYLPRMQQEIRNKHIGPSDVFMWGAINSLTDYEKKFAFEFTRGSDAVEMAYDTDIRKILTQYTNLASRKLFLRPAMKQIGDQIKQIDEALLKSGKPRGSGLQAYIDYTRSMFRDIEGIGTDGERQIRMATNNLHEKLRDVIHRGDAKPGATNPRLEAIDDATLKGFTNATQAKYTAKAKLAKGIELTQYEKDVLGGSDPAVAEITAMLSDNFEEAKSAGIADSYAKHSALDNLQKVLTASSLSFKPELVTRNLAQSLTVGAPVIGTRWWYAGLQDIMIPGNLARIDRLGLQSPTTVPIGTGELSKSGFLGKVVDVSMYPHKITDLWGRGIIYLGMEARVNSALDLRNKGLISEKAFARMSGMKMFGPEVQNEAQRILYSSKDSSAFVNFVAKTATDRTNFVYEKFNKPQAFKGVIGRMFGQFGSWSANYVNMTLDQLRQLKSNPAQAVGFLTRSAAVTYAIAHSFNQAGIDPAPYIPWETWYFSGGPYYSLANDLLDAGGGDAQAAHRAITNLKALIPFSGAATTLDRSLEAALEGSYYEAFVNLAIGHPALTVYPQRKGVIDQATSAAGKAAGKVSTAIGDQKQNFWNKL
jgi:hypothetical protein